jgi:SOS-response transcriptional repressor LexA
VEDQVSLAHSGARVLPGIPLEAIAEVEDYLAVDEAMAKRANFVSSRQRRQHVPGHWLDGDMVLVQNTSCGGGPRHRGGRPWTTDEATVKRLRRVRTRNVSLNRSTPPYPFLRGRKIAVVGKVTSLIRTFF